MPVQPMILMQKAPAFSAILLSDVTSIPAEFFRDTSEQARLTCKEKFSV